MAAQNITIVGAGIGGLTAALAFARNGHEVDIVEQAPELSDVGAGLQLSPNASRILIELGLGEPMRRAMTLPQRISLVSGRSLRIIADVPCGDFALDRWGAPYGVMHRSELQALLLTAVDRDRRCRLHLGQRVNADAPEHLPGRPDGRQTRLTVGADGVWSQCRKLVPGAAAPRFSGQVAWRFLVPAGAVRGVLSPGCVSAFLAPRTHLVAYPLASGAMINMVAIAGGKDPGPNWAVRENPASRSDLIDAFGGWHPDLVTVLREAPQMTWWPLFEVPDGRWSDDAGTTVLIGDAAHAMTPFAAQGAALAIEDGFELAQAVAQRPRDAAAISDFETRRRIRVGRARHRAAFNRFAYHARGPVRFGRDIVLALRSPESIAADFDWLYGYRATGL